MQQQQTTENNREILEKRYRTAAVVVIAQIVMTLALLGVAWFLITFSSNEVSDNALTALWMFVLLVAIGTFVLRRMLFSWERLKNLTLLKGVPALLNSLQTNTILLSSLGEIVAILGFLIAVLSGNKIEMLRAGAVALIIFLMNFPRKSAWKKILAAAEKL
jgi:uncharacterized membrane protein (DUF485 family)